MQDKCIACLEISLQDRQSAAVGFPLALECFVVKRDDERRGPRCAEPHGKNLRVTPSMNKVSACAR